MWILLFYICSFISGSCLYHPGSVAGGGAIELVAEEGDILIGNELIYFKFTQTNILRLSYYPEGIKCVQVSLWPLSWSFLLVDSGSTPQPRLKISHLVCPQPVGNFICIICFINWFPFPWNVPLREWSTKIFIIYLSYYLKMYLVSCE